MFKMNPKSIACCSLIIILLQIYSGPHWRLLQCDCERPPELDRVLKEQIVPELVDQCPDKVLGVAYGSEIEARFGNLVKPKQAREEPKFSYEAEQDQLYTIVMFDPDSPTREEPQFRSLLHFVKYNIPGNKTTEGDVYIEYVPPCPFEGKGMHRIVFLLYRQPDSSKPIDFEESIEKTVLRGRGWIDIRAFTEENSLDQPVAINFQLTDYDATVKDTVSSFSWIGVGG